MIPASGSPYITVSVNGAEGNFLLDWGSNTSAIDINAFDPVNQPFPFDKDPTNQNNEYRFKTLKYLFVAPYTPASLHMRAMNLIRGINQAGLLGTDFLKDNIFTIDYSAGNVHEYDAPNFCFDGVLLAEGFKPATTKGYFAQDSNTIVGQNIPVVPIQIGPIKAIAQIDTGADAGQFQNSVLINEVLYNALASSGLKLTATEVPARALSTCKSDMEQVTAYTLPSQSTFAVLGIDQQPVLAQSSITILVKHPTESVRPCQGIGFLPVPAAQFGNDILSKGQRIIFDAYSSRVWFQQH